MTDESRIAEIHRLSSLFPSSAGRLGDFSRAASASLPPVYRTLLDHDHHMTVTVEAFHNSPVDVRVLDRAITPTHYARLILLARRSDGAVVQFGIMRIDLSRLEPSARAEIESEKTPLGRVLIRHGVLTKIHLHQLWRVEAGEKLAAWFGVPVGTTTYGRTATIDCDGAAAIELIEIVAPASGRLE